MSFEFGERWKHSIANGKPFEMVFPLRGADGVFRNFLTRFHSAIHWYIDGIRERSDFDIRLEIPEDFGRLPRDMELVIFRLVQECLTNIHRHSGSKTASIRMAREESRIALDIRDEGKGIPLNVELRFARGARESESEECRKDCVNSRAR